MNYFRTSLLFLLFPAFILAEEIPISLSDCVRMALEKNLSLSVQRLNPEISRADLLSTHGPYDLQLTIDNQYGETATPATSRTFSQTRSNQHDITLNQKVPWGTDFGITTGTDNTMSGSNKFSDAYLSFTGATFTQPLLKNFGPEINLSDIRIARKSLAISEAALQNQIDQTVTDVASAYYELIFTRADSDSKLQSLRLAEQLLKDNQARAELGVMSPLDVSQANSDVASRREALLRAQRLIRDQQNTLLLLITSEVSEWLDKTIVPTRPESSAAPPPPLEKAIRTALQNRADYRQSVEEAEKSDLQLKYQNNQKWPTLDLSGSYGYAGTDASLGKSYADSAEFDKSQWFLGLKFVYLFQNRSANGTLAATKLRKQQALLLLKKSEQDLVVGVDNTLGQVSTNRERIESAIAARKFAEEALQAEEEKLRAGASTTFTVLQLQRDLSNAKSLENRAIADYDKSLSELNRVQGLSLMIFQEKP